MRESLAVYVRRTDGKQELTVQGRTWVIEQWYPVAEVMATIRRGTDGILVCDRARDFGGLGRQAVKMEKNIPVMGWLSEVYAVEK